MSTQLLRSALISFWWLVIFILINNYIESKATATLLFGVMTYILVALETFLKKRD